MVSFLKLVRLLRINRIIVFLRINKEVKAGLKLAKLMFFLFLYAHTVACMWFYLITAENVWRHPFDWIYPPEMEVMLYTESTTYKYLVSIYTSFMYLWANDVFPQTSAEILMAATVNFLSMFVIGLTFGEMLVLFYEINAKSIIF